MEGMTKTVLQVVFLLAFIWVLAWATGSAVSVSAPGVYGRIGKGKGRRGRRPLKYWQVSSGLSGVDIESTYQANPAGRPYSVF
jgi:hypothetical protein